MAFTDPRVDRELMRAFEWLVARVGERLVCMVPFFSTPCSGSIMPLTLYWAWLVRALRFNCTAAHHRRASFDQPAPKDHRGDDGMFYRVRPVAASIRRAAVARRRISRGVIPLLAVALSAGVLGLTPSKAAAADSCPGQPITLSANTTLNAMSNSELCSSDSQNQAFNLIMQTDGNLVLYVGRSKPLWYSGTGGHAAANWCLKVQTDGNLVIYPPGCVAPAIWSTGTGGHCCQSFYLYMQFDGNVVIYYANGTALWFTSTSNSGPDTIASEGGDCWSAAVRECSNPHNGQKDSFAYFEGINQTGRSGWVNALKAAAHAWDVYSPSPVYYNYCTGPRTGCVYTPNTSDMYVYLKTTTSDSTVYGVTIPSSAHAITFWCNSLNTPYACVSTFEAGVSVWAEIYFNTTAIDPYYTDDYLQNIAAHEMGHSVGLAHNWQVSSKNQAIMYPYTTDGCGNSCGAGGPTGLDVGTHPGCPGHRYGIDCIYGFYD